MEFKASEGLSRRGIEVIVTKDLKEMTYALIFSFLYLKRCRMPSSELKASFVHPISQYLHSHRVSSIQRRSITVTPSPNFDINLNPNHHPNPSSSSYSPSLHLGKLLAPLNPFFLPPISFSGPFFISSASPKSFQAASLTFCVALWIPNAACWSGTTSSSSSGLMG